MKQRIQKAIGATIAILACLLVITLLIWGIISVVRLIVG